MRKRLPASEVVDASMALDSLVSFLDKFKCRTLSTGVNWIVGGEIHKKRVSPKVSMLDLQIIKN